MTTRKLDPHEAAAYWSQLRGSTLRISLAGAVDHHRHSELQTMVNSCRGMLTGP
ncbi:hypothetical protein [Cryptosporangium phraense]|uniref:hypothetical protein n=1 Tax=Cryptosporangium phraense TaxID=2593070 RepID=UPI001478EE7C|nr:hypothetical protein [Cryptosporangium phraense]